MKIKRIFNFICFFIIAPTVVFFSFDTLISSFQIHQIKTQVEEFCIGKNKFEGIRVRCSKFDKYKKPKIKSDNNFWEEFDAQGDFNPSKIISYWPTYPFLKDIFIMSLVWTWLILAYRYLIKLFDKNKETS
ncbi:MAG TPA: hypothetical protein PKN32_08230 [Bacteroidales bacterium]|nr:hypothetical protein [Bacteroidales bacterium]